MKFYTATLATILLELTVVNPSDAAASSVSSIRGVTSTQQHDDKAWSTTHFGTTRTHRHLGQDNADCLMVERSTMVVHDTHQEREGLSREWVCEFPFAVAQSELEGHIFIDIDMDDVPMAMIDSMGAQSGASILRTTGAYVEELLDPNAMTHKWIMHVPPTASMEIVSIDSEHGSQHSRRLASSNPGTLSVLVVKVIDSAGASINANNEELYNDFFGNEFSLKTGIESCSKGQLIIEPAADQYDGTPLTCSNYGGIDTQNPGTRCCPPSCGDKCGAGNCNQGTNCCGGDAVGKVCGIDPLPCHKPGEIVRGITSVVVEATQETIKDGHKSPLEEGAISNLEEEYGNISSEYDLVILCMPYWHTTAAAYAYVNSWLSVYKDNYCQNYAVQMHEIGHNLGFAHSSQDGLEYGDMSGFMGNGFGDDGDVKMCFNAPKNFQSGWYTDAQESFYPFKNQNSVVERTFIGIEDYQVSSDNIGNLITLRLGVDENDASTYCYNRDDYYIGFNLKEGINEGTVEGGNQVLIFHKQTGGPTQFGHSDRIADLNPGESYTIQGFKGTSINVTISVKAFGNYGRTAPIKITTESYNDVEMCSNDPLDKSPEVVQKDPIEIENDPNGLNPDDIQHIVLGDSSDDGEFPYYVLLGGCGGSLIAPRVVLTAAHCNPRSGQFLTVGTTDRSDRYSLDNDDFQQARNIKIKEAILHPTYDQASWLDNDVALVLLEEEYVIDSSIRLFLNHDSSFPPDGEELDVLGMGIDSSGWVTQVLKDVKVESLSNSQCSESVAQFPITENMICAVSEEGRTAGGDSGGPLVKIVGNTHTQVGVVSWGIGFTSSNLRLDEPGGYSRVSENFGWMRNQICNDWEVESSLCPPTPPPAPTISPAPSNAPTKCSEHGRFRIELLTDTYGSETSWNLFRTPSSNNGIVGGDGEENGEVVVIGPRPEDPKVYTGDEAYTFPYCLEESYCYEFKIMDSYGDGICCNQGSGSYKGYLDGIKIFEGGNFTAYNDTRNFCVDAAPSNAPTDAPTDVPSSTPTNAPTEKPCDIDLDCRKAEAGRCYYEKFVGEPGRFLNRREKCPNGQCFCQQQKD